MPLYKNLQITLVGPPGCGKSTIAKEVEKFLLSQDHRLLIFKGESLESARAKVPYGIKYDVLIIESQS